MKKILLFILLGSFAQTRAQIITTVAGTGTAAYTGDGGPAINATFAFPGGLVFDAAGNLYIADSQSSQIRVIDASGNINLFAGSGNVLADGYSGDGGPALGAQIHNPVGITFDANGNMIFADMGNNVIRKINTAGTIHTIAGTGTQGYSGNNSPAVNAQLSTPSGVAVAPNGDIYIADYLNNVVRKINSAGIITNVAGYFQGFCGDGGLATAATLYNPFC